MNNARKVRPVRAKHGAAGRLLAALATAAAMIVAVGSADDTPGTPPADEPLEQVTRSGFSMGLPAWTVEIDDDLGANGRHVRTKGPRRAEAAWFLHAYEDLVPFDAALAALRQGYDAEVVARREVPGGDVPRLEAVIDFGGRAWMVMTQLACPAVGVAATVTVMTPGRDEAEALSRRMLGTFACRSAELPRLVETWPDSDLPQDFGLDLEGSPVLVHADGRWLMVARQSTETVHGMAADDDRAQRVLAGYGAALGDAWSLSGAGRETRNLSGPATTWVLRSAQLGAVAASAFTCAGDGSAFIVLAGDDSGAGEAAGLAALAARFGCPGATDAAPVTERPSACEAGVADFCGPP